MPSVSPKQRRTMAAAAHDPAFAAKMGIPMKVATDFNQADKLKRQAEMAEELREPSRPPKAERAEERRER